MTKSVMLAGVGGQGTILASKILTIGLMEAGYDVKMNEIHGMSQRGGAVTSEVRYSKDKVYSPTIERGEAEMLVAFEKMEALRRLESLKPGGKIVVNNYRINSVASITQDLDYKEDEVDEELKSLNAVFIDAAEEAKKLGNAKVMNIILLGTLIKGMNLTSVNWEEIIRKNVKEKFIDINIEALKLGMNLID